MGRICDPFELPSVSFIAGTTQNFLFKLYQYESKSPIDVSDGDAQLCVVDFNNRDGTPILTKEISRTESSLNDNEILVTLSPDDTIDMVGKFIYQISINNGGTVDAYQGEMFVYTNIDKDFLEIEE